jgi:hypothetical protein
MDGADFHDHLMNELNQRFVLPWPPSHGAGPDAEGVPAFLRSAYVVAAELGGWDRRGLERQ